MPKYGVHEIVLSKAIKKCSGYAVSDILSNNRDIAMLGAIGPDLFFWAPDYPVVQVFMDIYKAINEMNKAYNDIVGPIVGPFEEAADAIEEQLVELGLDDTVALIKKTREELEKTKDALQSTLTTGALATALRGTNLLTDMASLPGVLETIFMEFTPRRQYNEPENNWYWFDMLHYRNTGDFAHCLVKYANSPEQQAYALGYMSHIATDLTGHPYVNQIVGGPFRLHCQRHTTVENFIDSRMFDEEYEKNINTELQQKLGVEEFDVLSGSNPPRLPEDIINLIDKAFRVTYKSPPHPNFLTRKQINETYENYQIVINCMNNTAISRPIEPFSDVGKILSDALEDFLDTPPPPQPPNPFSGGIELSLEGVQRCLNNIEDLAKWVGEMVNWSFDLLIDLFDLLAAASLSLPFTVQLAGYYGIQLILYDIYQYIRLPLVLGGVLYPEPKDLYLYSPLLTTTYQNCIPDLYETYPKKKSPNRNHLTCPSDRLFEKPPIAPAFYPQGSLTVTPYDFIKDVDPDMAAFGSYAQATKPDETKVLHSPPNPLRVGNAIDLATFMIQNAHNNNCSVDVFTNFDLDSDRGYFYKTWGGTINNQVSNIGDYK